MRIHRFRITAVLAAAAMIAAAGIAIAESGAGQGVAPDRDAATITTIDPSVTEHFAIFRQSLAVPASARPQALTQRGGLFGINMDYARVARQTATGADAYVVPGNGVICLFGNEVGGACAPTAAAVSTPALTVGICGAHIPAGRLIAAGVVPDGLEDVVVHLRDGTTAKGDVQGNVYTGYAPLSAATLPTSVTWTGRDGVNRSLAVAVPESATANPCERAPAG